jgi:hypothetical protein
VGRISKATGLTRLVGEMGYYPPVRARRPPDAADFADDEDASVSPHSRLARERLYLARRHVAQGEQLISSQQALIARLKAGGHEAEQAWRLLDNLMEIQSQHECHLSKLEAAAAPAATMRIVTPS